MARYRVIKEGISQRPAPNLAPVDVAIGSEIEVSDAAAKGTDGLVAQGYLEPVTREHRTRKERDQ